MAAAAATAVVSDDGDHAVLHDDERGSLATLVEADTLRHAAPPPGPPSLTSSVPSTAARRPLSGSASS
ncbi:hypothetical protein E2562_019352 [Oryza meyeriana var. granulata]|uniref:Uncharacterized protein n=1 Tax=Oryza meyeriana var. granulata TaxID=110450 RepID=A0A6G1BM19_9ORYZ|nr:hypothetical protein E2562_019352 [Oryza meyeriana var. granulata]